MKSKIELKKMLADSSIKTLDYLEQLLVDKHDEENTNLMILIRSNLNSVEKVHTSGVSNYDDYQRGLNQVSVNILKIIDTLPDNYFSTDTKERKTNDVNTYEIEVLSLLRALADIEIKESDSTNAAVNAYLNSKRHLLAIQAIRMINQNNVSISSLEYSLIANAFFRNVDPVKAEEIYKKAIESIDEYSDTAQSKIRAIRAYANFLYNINRTTDAAKQYESAILEGNTEADNIENGYTLQMLFSNECDSQDYERAVKTYKKAKDYLLKIGNSQVRSYQLNFLETVWNNKKVPPNYSRP
jgi:tetratricopeptide (TPR) repeat protein